MPVDLAYEAAVAAQQEERMSLQRGINASMDNSQRLLLNQQINFATPIDSFSPAEQAIINGPRPPYSQAELDADARHIKFECPLLKDVPDQLDRVMWREQIFDKNLLEGWIETQRSHSLTIPVRDLVTNVEIPLPQLCQFLNFLRDRGTENQPTCPYRSLMAFEQAEIELSVQNYNLRQNRRDTFLRWKSLRERLDVIIASANARNQQRSNPPAVAPAVAPAPAPAPGNLEGSQIDNSSDSDSDLSLLRVNAVVNNNRNRRRRGTSGRRNTGISGGTGTTRRRNTSTATGTSRSNNNNPNGRNGTINRSNNGNGNPLDAAEEGARIPIPMNMWGDPQIETAVRAFYLLVQEQGFDTFYRRKTSFLQSNLTAIFGTGGPFEMYQRLTWQVFGQRLSRVDNHFNNLLANHNNDPTGEEGEERPIWFDILRIYRQFCDNHRSGAAAQRNRNELNDVTAQLGAVQPPLGPGNPTRRSEVAAQNDPQMRGPPHVGDGVRVLEAEQDGQLQGEDDTFGENTNNNNEPTRRRRRTSRIVSRNNRQRISGNARNIQDTISEGRQHMGLLAESLSDVANAISTPAIQQPPMIPLNQNPIEGLTAISAQMRLLANDLESPQRRQINQQLVGSWQGLLGRFHEVNGLDPLPRTSHSDPRNNNDLESDEDEEPFLQSD